MKFKLDENLDACLAEAMQKRGMDAPPTKVMVHPLRSIHASESWIECLAKPGGEPARRPQTTRSNGSSTCLPRSVELEESAMTLIGRPIFEQYLFDVPGSVAKSTHAGLPWLRCIRQKAGPRVHFWPFDGWEIPAGRSVMAEVYPSLWSRSFEREGRTSDQHDAYSVAAWMRQADRDGRLAGFFAPCLSPPERTIAQVEGWILGVN